MKPVIVHLKLPDDLGKRATEIARQPLVGMDSSPFTVPRAIRDVILEALREQWMPQIIGLDPEVQNTTGVDLKADYGGLARDDYPYGSIPAEQKRA